MDDFAFESVETVLSAVQTVVPLLSPFSRHIVRIRVQSRRVSLLPYFRVTDVPKAVNANATQMMADYIYFERLHFAEVFGTIRKIFTGRLPLKFTQCVSFQKSAFSPLQEKLCVGSKNDWHVLNCHDLLYQRAKFGGDRTTRAGCRSENWCFLYVTLGLPARGDILQTSIEWRSMDRFWYGFQRVFQNRSFCQIHYIVLIFVARWRHSFRAIAVKNYEKSENRRKSLCAPLRIDSWRIWKKIPLQ